MKKASIQEFAFASALPSRLRTTQIARSSPFGRERRSDSRSHHSGFDPGGKRTAHHNKGGAESRGVGRNSLSVLPQQERPAKSVLETAHGRDHRSHRTRLSGAERA